MKNSIKLFAVAFFLFTMACKDDPITEIVVDENISTYKGTQSPGDVWDWTLNHDKNTFTAVWDYGSFDDESDDITIEGTMEILPSGFLKCVIASVNPVNADIPADGTAWFYAMHLPNMAMIIKPEGSIKGDMITTVASGDCADVPGEYNYFKIAPGNGEAFDPVTEEAYGRASLVDNGDGTYNIHGDKYSLDCANAGPCTVNNAGITGLPVGQCTENGTMVISSDLGETITEGQFTASGVMMLDTGKGNGGVVALSKANSFTVNELVDLSFVGLAYFPANTSDKVVPVNLSFVDTGVMIEGTGTMIDDINTGTLSSDAVSLRFDENDQGLWLGQMNHVNGLSTSFVSSLLVSDGKKMIVLSSTTSPENKPFILVVVNK